MWTKGTRCHHFRSKDVSNKDEASSVEKGVFILLYSIIVICYLIMFNQNVITRPSGACTQICA